MCLGLTVISVTFACATTRVPKNLALEQLLGSQAAGRDILLKISPACDACLQTTRQVLSEYPARRVIAITYVNAGRSNRDYMERFHIPLVVFGVQEFFALDGTLEVPRCYRLQGTQLIACQTRTSREPGKHHPHAINGAIQAATVLVLFREGGGGGGFGNILSPDLS